MTICPCCNDTLLRSIYQKKIIWFCPSCRQQMPNLEIINQSKNTQENLEIINVSYKKSSEILFFDNTNLQKQNFLLTELPPLKSFIIRDKLRLYIVEIIIAHSSKLVINAVADEFLLKNRIKNNYSKITCLYDGKLILHCIMYSFLTGDIAITEHNCLNKLKQTYIDCGTPLDNIANFINILKNRTIFLLSQGTSKDLKSTLGKYYATYSSLTSELAIYFDETVKFLASG